MILDILSYIARFIFIVLIQVLVINNLEITTYINPYIYIVIILSLPFNTKPWVVLVISLLAGTIMDSFSNSPGLHMAACVFMGYFRRFYLLFSTNKEDQSSNNHPSISSKGWVWFITYALILTFLHHFVLFFLEAYSIFEFTDTVFRIFFSSIFSVLIITIGQLLFYKVSKKSY